MFDSINTLNERVERHFEALSRVRKNSNLPIFAMEHRLSEEELKQLQCVLSSHYQSHSLQSSIWLLWVVFATEVGYDYTGEEYWSSFEKRILGWEYNDRYKIKSWFERFQTTYNGVIPSGRWAEHFTIITWPITHAILPVYLQRQFARSLYNLRFRLLTIEIRDTTTIGKLLAANTHMPTSRFKIFLEQEEMIGRIVLALLGEEPFEDISNSNHRIYRPTLKRIVADLERFHESQEWMDEIRRIVTDRFKGIGHGSGPRPHGEQKPDSHDTTHLKVRPKMLLRHASMGSWDVLIDVPSFRAISALNKDVQSFLESTRFRLNGGDGMKPGRWLLSSSSRKGIIQSWPDEKRPLILFEQTHSAIDHIMNTECRLDSGLVWLFRIGPDGIAREIKGRTVRPDYSYIVVTTGNLPQAHVCMSSCNLNCANVRSFRIAIPPQVSTELTNWLDTIGLQVARTVRVWPAGIPGRGWDGQGNSEWLTTEEPCFGICHDHPVDAYSFRLDDSPEGVIQTDCSGDPIFVQLVPLPVGTYNLKVKAHRNPDLDIVASSSPAEGFLQLNVREPEPWMPGVTSHPGFIVTIDPHEFDLETFWRNEIRLSVNGPAGYTATLSIKLETVDGKQIIEETLRSQFNLPIKPSEWYHKFSVFQQQNKNKTDWAYLEAAIGTLTIDCGTLGICSLTFEHRTRPLRWLARRDGKDIVVKLVDDTGQEEPNAKVYCYCIGQPLEKLSLELKEALSGIVVKPPGSLFVAELSKYTDSVAVSTKPIQGGFQGLGISPNFSNLPRSPQSCRKVLILLARWQEARLYGFLPSYRYRKVMEGLVAVLFEMLCGQNWANAESKFINDSASQQAKSNLLSQVERNPGFAKFANELNQNLSIVEESSTQRINWFCVEASRHLRPKNDDLCKFALRLACQPHKLRTSDFESLDSYYSDIVDNPVILRAARLLVLLTVDSFDDTAIFTE